MTDPDDRCGMYGAALLLAGITGAIVIGALVTLGWLR